MNDGIFRLYRQDRREQALAWLAQQGEVDVYRLMRGLGIKKSNASKILSRFAAEGVLLRVRFGVYKYPRAAA